MQKIRQIACTAAVLTLLVSTPAVRADEATNDPEARIGIPPGVSAQATSPGDPSIEGSAPAPSPDDTETSQTRTDVHPGIGHERPYSLWATFMTWLDEQLQRVTKR